MCYMMFIYKSSTLVSIIHTIYSLCLLNIAHHHKHSYLSHFESYQGTDQQHSHIFKYFYQPQASYLHKLCMMSYFDTQCSQLILISKCNMLFCPNNNQVCTPSNQHRVCTNSYHILLHLNISCIIHFLSNGHPYTLYIHFLCKLYILQKIYYIKSIIHYLSNSSNYTKYNSMNWCKISTHL